MNLEAIQEVIKENEWKIKKEDFDNDLKSYIISLYERGVSARNLGIKYSIDKRRVQKWAREKGIERTLNESHRLNFFNECFFDEIDIPLKAYWLGFLYADGSNCKRTNTISISLKSEDKNHLLKLSDALELTPRLIYNSERGTGCYTLNIYSKHICNILESNGCIKNKSLVVKYPEWIRPDLDVHFIRGFFDGDGCLTFRRKKKEWKWSVTSTKEMCSSINDKIKKNLGLSNSIYYISKTNNNTYSLETGGNEKIHKIMDWLYLESNASIRLDRKFDKYIELLDHQRGRSSKNIKYTGI